MAWNSAAFISGVGGWLAANNANSDEATATEIARFYGISARTVFPKSPSFASPPLTLKPDRIIASGFEASFKLARALPSGVPSPIVWQPAALAIVSYWTAVNFSPVPPPPGGLAGTVNITTFSGSPTPLNFDIGQAFQEGDPFSTAQSLNDAIVSHLEKVTGTWTGTAPGSPPPPLVVPWVGLA